MNLKILFILIVYYGIISLVILTGDMFSGYTVNVNIDNSDLKAEESDLGGLFGSGVSFGRFFSLATVGIGLGDDAPDWFKMLFATWQTILLLLSIGFIIDSIWSG